MKDTYISNPFAQLLDKMRNLQISVDKIDAKISAKDQIEQDTETELLTTDEVCDLLSISRVTVWHWEKKGILRSTRLGNLKRFRRADIDDLFNNQKGV